MKMTHLSSDRGWHCCRGPPTRPMMTRADVVTGGSPCTNTVGTMAAALSRNKSMRSAYSASLVARDGSVAILHQAIGVKVQGANNFCNLAIQHTAEIN